MKIHDSLLGSILLILALALWFGSGSLPNPTQQPYGPDFFPRILAFLLAIASLALVANGLRQKQNILTLDDWTRNPRAVASVLMVPLAVLGFLLGMDTLGFIPCSILLVLALCLVDGVPPLKALAFAVVVAFAVHAMFYLGLRVQLPWGLLQPIRW